MNKKRLIEVCELIVQDVKNDAKEFDGKEFNGKNVATYFGRQGAAIGALADIIREVLKEESEK